MNTFDTREHIARGSGQSLERKDFPKMDQKLVESLCDVVTETKKLQMKIPHDLQKKLLQLEKLLLKASDPQIFNLKDIYYHELTRVKHVIAKDFRSHHDRIFINCLHMSRDIQPITFIFEAFIKGITFFASETEASVPIYHRLYSCGPYADTHRQGNLICAKDISKQEKARRRSLIERCYIERLIYDKIFLHETLHFPASGSSDHSQDKGHVHRLDLTRQDFETCFPDTNIDVSVEYEGKMPTKLIITKTRKGKTTVVTWYKAYNVNHNGIGIYSDMVDCKKEEGGKTYIKTNTFAYIGKFQSI